MEREFAAELRRAGIKFRRQHPILGKPDFVIFGKRVAIFCDSRFWHGYRWGKGSSRAFARNAEFWVRKIEGNRERDRLVSRALRRKGWRVVRLWEHEVRGNPARCIAKVRAAIEGHARIGRNLR